MPNQSFIQLYTGDGKGKTTAALGLAIRALGRGWKVGIVYFDKGGSDYGERRVLDTLKERGVDYEPSGLDRRDRTTGRFRFGVTDEDRAEGARGLAVAAGWLASGQYQLVVLDEVNTAASLGIVQTGAVIEAIRSRHPQTEVVLTGRSAPAELVELADLVSEVKLVKHYFHSGQAAREGIEF